MNKRIYRCLAHMSGKEQLYIKEAFDTNWVVPLGPNVNGFEKDLEEFVGEDKRVVALSAGTAAVHLALIACGVNPGDEVLVQSFTFCASSHPITYLGATPVFVDSEPQTWNMDPELLEEAIKDRIRKTGKKPKAIIPVALYGMPYDCDRIMEVANFYDIPVIEDAAEGFGSKYKGQVLGTFGRYGVLSFNGNKMITTSGGGALICPDAEQWQRVMWYATQARESYPYYQHGEIGYNYRMSNICAGIGRGQMAVVDDHVAHHKHMQALYELGVSAQAVSKWENNSSCPDVSLLTEIADYFGVSVDALLRENEEDIVNSSENKDTNAKSSDDKKNIMIKVTQQNGKENIIKVPFKFVKLGLNIGNMFGLSKDVSDKIATLAENDMTDIVNIDTENGEHIAITLD